MKILDDMRTCYGCGACSNICPVEAIRMNFNMEGFLEPVIDENSCVSCGKCKQVCPSLNSQYPNDPDPDIFAFAAEEKILYNSSSGGIFTFLAESILRAGGYVVGAAYDLRFYVNHVIIHNVEDLDKIRRSKYLQSSTGDTFKQTKELLEKGKYVLYSGCPCQIAGLLRFLGKNYDNLYTVDVVCHGVPSPGSFQAHLKNSFGGIEKIGDIEFRSREGWASLFKVRLKSGEFKTFSSNNSIYMRTFLQDVNLRASCFQCQYSRLPRQGDITIGDLWSAANCNLSFDYRKGVSVVLLNNKKGERLFQDALSKSDYQFHMQKLCGKDVAVPCNKAMLNGNIFRPAVNGNSIGRRQRFFDNYANMAFERAAYVTLHPFDVGLMLFMSSNYGSIAASYALYKTISDTGRKVAVLDNMIPVYGEAAAFAKGHMNLCSTFMARYDNQAANQCFETFVVGSDVSWNWIGRPWNLYLQYWMLGFASENKRLLSYAPSFGYAASKADIDEDLRALCVYCLNRFDAISVREDRGADICRDLFGVQAEQVLDPVFLCGREAWDELAAMSQIEFGEDYLLAYILDPTQHKRQVLLEAAKALNKKLVVILDLEGDIEGKKQAMNLDGNLVRPGFIDWLAYFKNASYVITDSFHGACFSILYGKKFVSIKNRAKERFDSLARLIECPFLFFEDYMPLLGKADIFSDIDYAAVYKRLEAKQAESREWLYSALCADIKPKGDDHFTPLLWQITKTLSEKSTILNKISRDYAYEEEEKKKINALLQGGKTWLDVVFSQNHIVAGDVKFRTINDLREYFSQLKADTKYVAVLSCADECSNHLRKFVDVSGLPLHSDIGWRDSYVAVIDGGTVKIEEKSKEEINTCYEFVTGHPNYSVEYLNHKLSVCCTPLRYCQIRVKSKGFTMPTGASKSEIVVNNINYSMNRTGINMVVIDKETGEVVDSININTYADATLRINRV